MQVEAKKYKSVDNTVKNMYAVVQEFKDIPELQIFNNYSIKQIYDYISKIIPYVPDPVPYQVAHLRGDAVELLKSPLQTMYNGGDCDDKSILAACIFEVKKIPYRFVCVSTQKNKALHHVYLEIFVNGKWSPFDATYPHYKIFWENPFTKKKIYALLNNSLHISEAQPMNMNCRTCAQPCLSGNYANNYLKNKFAAQLLGSSAHTEKINGVQLHILRGVDTSNCNCGGPCCKSKKYRSKLSDRRIINQGRRQLLGAALGLGDPVTVVTTIATVASSLFGGLFKKEAYQDAYNAWSQAEAQLPGLAQAAAAGDPNALAQLSVVRALIAVLSRDYMNPPMGADFETSPGRRGNRAEWLKIQPDVEAKAAAFAPFMQYLNKKHIATNGNPPMRLEDLVSYYDMFKNQSGLYTEFAAQQKSGNNKTTTSGKLNFSGPGLLLLAGAVAVAFKLKGKK